MASTTLTTFMLQAPLSVCSVEILGSWDNFSKPYQLQRDRRTGPGHWRGCHTFKNITCDGESLNALESRDGGLKMGGTYWYYYVLDGDIEYHDPAEPFTDSCPLLPGQMVNVLDVPMQSKTTHGGSPNGSTASVDSFLVFTLDPKDKYLPAGVRRANTTSAVQKKKAQMAASTSQPQLRTNPNDPEPRVAVSRTGQSTLERQRSLLSVFHRLRQTRSAGSNVKSGPAWPRKIFSRSSSRAGLSLKDDAADAIPEVPKIPSQLPSWAAAATHEVFELPIQQPEMPPPKSARAPLLPRLNLAKPASPPNPHDDKSQGQCRAVPADLEYQESYIHPATSIGEVPEASSLSFPSSCFTPFEQLKHHFAEASAAAKGVMASNELNDEKSSGLDVPGDEFSAINVPVLPKRALSATRTPVPPAERPAGPDMPELCPTSHSYAESSASSCAISDETSPYCASNTTHSNPMSPLHLSQPETPIMSEFDDDHFSIRRNSASFAQLADDFEHTSLRPPSRAPPLPPPPPAAASKPATAYSSLGGSQGYSLPNSEHASVSTIRKLPSTTFKPSEPFHQQGSKQNLVQSWNDGSEHRMSALSDLVEDLGYLGALII